MLTTAPRGTRDIFGEYGKAFLKAEEIIKEMTRLYNISEIRTPIFEHTELFKRGVGEHTDIVQKEMYTFTDKGDRSLTLRPEGTAGTVRAYLENKMYNNIQPTKLYYVGPMFRYERPQAGRMRQFHQFGMEYFGSYNAESDAEVISFVYEFLKRCGITNITLAINSIGCKECRGEYNKKLTTYIKNNIDGFCETCKVRADNNPLRVLDCKSEQCGELLKNAPSIFDSLDDECNNHFEQLKSYLSDFGIEYTISDRIVRGLDYYNRTVFEFISNEIGSQGTVCGGGRYDGLITEFGGSPTGGVGFAIGIERLVMLMTQNSESLEDEKVKLYIGSIGELGTRKSQLLAYNLRKQDIAVETDLIGRSVKAQMKFADKIKAEYSMIIGDLEVENDKATIKNMTTGETKEISLDEIQNVLQ